MAPSTSPPAPTAAGAPAPKNATTINLADTLVPTCTPIVVVTPGLCTHDRLTRVPHRICRICHRRHFFNWVYYCEMCGTSACHNCRPRWVERTWVDFATVLEGK